METTAVKRQLEIKETDSVVIRFSGDSGDGMQLTGMQFTDTTAILGNDLSTFPEFPAEIRAPAGTLAGVSGFQVHFGSKEIFTPGDKYDVLVAMNAAALKADLKNLREHGVIIVNTAGFDERNLKLAQYPEGAHPLDDGSLDHYRLYKLDISRLTKDSMDGLEVSAKDVDRAKNMFVLGLLFWMFERSVSNTEKFIQEKFSKKPLIQDANIRALRAGFNYGETAEIFTTRYHVAKAKMPPGVYRNITGNQALAIGLIAAGEKSGLPVFLGSYPITPASDILHELSRYKANGVRTFQAEDEISAITSAIGASYGGALAVTTTAGPGLALKTEAMGFATMLEIPLVIIDVQRGGPSTGLPTRTEQADLMMAMFGRHGEAPLPIVAVATPADCFETIYEACRITLEHMTPVIVLSDGYIANGSEPWKFPAESDLKSITVHFTTENNNPSGGTFLSYKRNDQLVRPWVKPGTRGLEHRIGGLEKQHETGNVSYDPANHERMVKIRAEKVEKIADSIPPAKVDSGREGAKVCVLGWGSTYGSIKGAVTELIAEGHDVAHIHLRHLNPFPKNLGDILRGFGKVLIPEINNGQLVQLIRAKYLIPAVPLNKIMGLPFATTEIKSTIKEML
ncbi:MAG TPA: 2-oxoacid:acceptor oxidoreductase subunit alpha [Leptospiraceae bacterium]|nr:2-oxoacid:acceptor oxidoreductase subunit alpha [Leptospiraceae bacterium]HMZ35223.1 2-oxoacid:acceptor oxidoreductase subunit alpha [Leptospiraceae bacterium]HNL70095.1 2-oxoacid:acceptor oxidoreductase subunit alpha [Leptospiraceae bacterium]HNN59040.1 2-oxoacid:acceptor oxidoreductase subunit alpha [Leptospiraceae bacterium]HNN73079.1 2-oxoacid:acceptor oxidoreductase subunit alpha [Leptospiraceae bacterium]